MAAVQNTQNTPWICWTLWDNPVTRLAYDGIDFLPRINIAALPIIKEANQGIERALGMARGDLSRIVSRFSLAFPRMAYEMAQRLCHTVLVLKALADLDAYNKTLTFANGNIFRPLLGKDHLFVRSLEIGNTGVAGLLVGRHLEAFANGDVLNIWDKDGSFNKGKVCKSLYGFLFQMSHVCNFFVFLKEVEVLDLVPMALSIGNRYPFFKSFISKCIDFGLRALKDRLVVVASIVAALVVVEWGYFEWNRYWSRHPDGSFAGFLDSVTDRDEEEHVNTTSNNVSKGYVVYSSTFGKWAKIDSIFEAFCWVLGLTNLNKGATNMYKDEEKETQFKSKLGFLAIQAIGARRAGRQFLPLTSGDSVSFADDESLAQNTFIVVP